MPEGLGLAHRSQNLFAGHVSLPRPHTDRRHLPGPREPRRSAPPPAPRSPPSGRRLRGDRPLAVFRAGQARSAGKWYRSRRREPSYELHKRTPGRECRLRSELKRENSRQPSELMWLGRLRGTGLWPVPQAQTNAFKSSTRSLTLAVHPKSLREPRVSSCGWNSCDASLPTFCLSTFPFAFSLLPCRFRLPSSSGRPRRPRSPRPPAAGPPGVASRSSRRRRGRVRSPRGSSARPDCAPSRPRCGPRSSESSSTLHTTPWQTMTTRPPGWASTTRRNAGQRCGRGSRRTIPCRGASKPVSPACHRAARHPSQMCMTSSCGRPDSRPDTPLVQQSALAGAARRNSRRWARPSAPPGASPTTPPTVGFSAANHSAAAAACRCPCSPSSTSDSAPWNSVGSPSPRAARARPRRGVGYRVFRVSWLRGGCLQWFIP